jgi:hypothetical protein
VGLNTIKQTYVKHHVDNKLFLLELYLLLYYL